MEQSEIGPVKNKSLIGRILMFPYDEIPPWGMIIWFLQFFAVFELLFFDWTMSSTSESSKQQVAEIVLIIFRENRGFIWTVILGGHITALVSLLKKKATR